MFCSYFEISDNASVGAQESAAPTARERGRTVMWSIKIQESLTAVLGIVTLFCCFLLIDLYLSTCMYLSIVK